jgi:hypothetical protein
LTQRRKSPTKIWASVFSIRMLLSELQDSYSPHNPDQLVQNWEGQSHGMDQRIRTWVKHAYHSSILGYFSPLQRLACHLAPQNQMNDEEQDIVKSNSLKRCASGVSLLGSRSDRCVPIRQLIVGSVKPSLRTVFSHSLQGCAVS